MVFPPNACKQTHKNARMRGIAISKDKTWQFFWQFINTTHWKIKFANFFLILESWEAKNWSIFFQSSCLGTDVLILQFVAKFRRCIDVSLEVCLSDLGLSAVNSYWRKSLYAGFPVCPSSNSNQLTKYCNVPRLWIAGISCVIDSCPYSERIA